MSIEKKKRKVKLLFIFIVACTTLVGFYGYLRYERSIYQRLQALCEKNEVVFYQIKDICNRQVIERGETATFTKNGETWLFESSMSDPEERELFGNNDYMSWINYLDQQIEMKEVFFASDEIRFILNTKNDRYAEVRYTEEKRFLDRMRPDEIAELKDNWFLLGAYYSYESRIAEEDEMEHQKKAFSENIDLINEYIELSKHLGIIERVLSYDSASEDINLEQVEKGDELKRFEELTDELKELMGFKIIATDDSEMEFRFEEEVYSSIIKFSEASDFQTNYMNRDFIDEVLAPNWYYMIYFHHTPFEGMTLMDFFIDDSLL